VAVAAVVAVAAATEAALLVVPVGAITGAEYESSANGGSRGRGSR